MLTRNTRWFAWWYFAIAAGFFLLAIRRIMLGEKAWLIGLRLVIVAGFALLGYWQYRSSR